MALWAEAGENLRRIVPLLGRDDPPADEPEDCHLCPGCKPVPDERPVGGAMCGVKRSRTLGRDRS